MVTPISSGNPRERMELCVQAVKGWPGVTLTSAPEGMGVFVGAWIIMQLITLSTQLII